MALLIQGGKVIRYTEGTVTVPEGVTEIGENAFYLTKITGVALPESLRIIGESAFRGCALLERIEIPAGVTELGKMAFNACYALRSAQLPEGIVRIPDNCFHGCKDLKRIRIPDSVREIGFMAFSYCLLKELRLPEGLKTLGGFAFHDCRLTEVTVPGGLTDIGMEPFDVNTVIHVPTRQGVITVLARKPETMRTDQTEFADLYALLTSEDSAQADALFAKLKCFAYKAAAAVFLAQERGESAYTVWLKRMIKRLLEAYAAAGSLTMLRLLLNAVTPTKAHLEHALTCAQERGNVEVTAWLLDRSAALGGKQTEMKL